MSLNYLEILDVQGFQEFRMAPQLLVVQEDQLNLAKLKGCLLGPLFCHGVLVTQEDHQGHPG